MSGFPILDLILGLVFIFFILSIITSSVVEVIMTRTKTRNKFLAKWLLTIFDKKVMQPDGKVLPLGRAIMDHCLTTALSEEGQANSFMDGKSFVTALVEKITFDVNDPNGIVLKDLKDLLEKIRNAKALDGTSMLSTELRRVILIYGAEAMQTAETTPNTSGLQIFYDKLEKWFDASMDRVSGKMKSKYIRPFTFWTALIIVVALNADTLQISKYLYENKEETKLFADKVETFRQGIDSTILKNDSNIQKTTQKISANVDSLKNMVPKGMPLGWDDAEVKKSGGYVKAGSKHIIGWLVTVMAIMLGAPFWFDLLNKIANIRSTGAKPSSTTDPKNQATGTGGKS